MSSLDRRSFIQTSAATLAGGYALPQVGFAKSGPSANSKLNVACVGIGHMGSAAVNASKTENIVALCDVDWRSDGSEFGSRSPLAIASKFPDAKRFTDFRKMLDKMGNEIDAVMVSTPDHTHFAVAMAAMEAGKHVFVQKPLAHNIWQVRTLQKAAEYYKVKTVMGNQGHCFEGMKRIIDWYKMGIVGDVTEVDCWTDRPVPSRWFRYPKSMPPKTDAIPEGVDWDLWQGPTANRDFSNEYMPQRWRGWWDYGCGGLGDIGCHCIEAPYWALDLGMPHKVEIAAKRDPGHPEYTPAGSHVTYHFAARGDKPAVKVHWYEGGYMPKKPEGMTKFPSNGMLMYGSKETVYSGDMRPTRPRLWPLTNMRKYTEKMKEQITPRSKAGHPFGELFDAVKGNIAHAGSHFDYAAPLTELVLLGAMAIRSGKTFDYDAKKMQTSDAEVNEWIKEPTRKGWEYGEKLWKA